MWGEIGTDRKALITFNLEEENAKIHIYAFPRENVTKEIQDALFVEWKNGGDYTFPENAIHWEIDANSDTILPENMKVDRLDTVLQSQHKWGKKLMSSKINQLLTDEVKRWIKAVSSLHSSTSSKARMLSTVVYVSCAESRSLNRAFKIFSSFSWLRIPTVSQQILGSRRISIREMKVSLFVLSFKPRAI